MPTHRAFLRTAAVCWMVTGFTTLGLIFLPRLVPPAPDVLSRALGASNGVYQLRLWIGVLHPGLAVTAALGVALALGSRAPARAATGALCFFVWGQCELVQQALVLVGLTWRLYPRYLAAVDNVARHEVAASIDALRATSDALFFALLLAFIAGNLLLAWAMQPHAHGLGRVVAVIFVLAAGLGAVSFATQFGAGVVPAGAMELLYPLIQPAGRVLTGVWLWRFAGAELPTGDNQPALARA
jgi:hypothetical protein